MRDDDGSETRFGPFGYQYAGGVCIKVTYKENNEIYESYLAVNSTNVEYLVFK